MSNSKTIDDGGSAFPIVATETNEHGIVFPFITPGLSMRDWFAGQALSNQYAQHDGDPNKVAEWAYHIADAMIAARKAGAA